MTTADIDRHAALPPVRITLPKTLLAPFAVLAQVHGCKIEDCQGAGPDVAVLIRPQLRMWILATWADVYGHQLKALGGRCLHLVPTAIQQEAA